MLTIPNLPTDNLYKFKFLGGISILIFTAYLYSTQINTSISKLIELEIEVQKAKYQVDILKSKSREIEKETLTFNSEYNRIKKAKTDSIFDLEKMKGDLLNDKNYRDYLQFFFAHKNEILPTGQSIEKIEKLQLELTKINNALDNNLINVQISIVKSKYEIYRLILVGLITFILFIYGKKITNTSYNEWYTLVQKPNDDKLKEEIDKLKIENIKNCT